MNIMKNENVKIFFAAKTDKKEIRGFISMDAITPEKLDDMKKNPKSYIGKVIMSKHGKLYKVIRVKDSCFECEELTLQSTEEE